MASWVIGELIRIVIEVGRAIDVAHWRLRIRCAARSLMLGRPALLLTVLVILRGKSVEAALPGAVIVAVASLALP